MANRSANASIKGYMYQFIHTISDILDNNEDALNTIEGIEDLDIRNGSEKTLVQYKYHELASFRDSLVAKPIGLMFDHFILHSGKYNYRLAIHMDDKLPSIDINRLHYILSLKSAQNHISSENIKYCSDCLIIEDFLGFFECTKTEEYTNVESKIIDQLKDEFHISNEEAEIIYLPNAIKKIIDLGRQNNVKNRKIKTSDFKGYLNSKKAVLDIAFTSTVYGETKAVQQVLQRMKNDGCRKNNTDIFLFFNGPIHQLDNLVIDLAKTYFYKGNKKDYRPITFIVNNSLDLKTEIAKRIHHRNEEIIFNDGYEDYCFCKEVFNSKAITTVSPNRGKVNNVNYNFRILSTKTLLKNKNNIIINNGTLISVGAINEEIEEIFCRTYHLGRFKNSSIMDIVGGCNG